MRSIIVHFSPGAPLGARTNAAQFPPTGAIATVERDVWDQTKRLVHAVFDEITRRVRVGMPDVEIATESSRNDAFPLRMVLRLSSQGRSVLATVDFRHGDRDRVVVRADICLDEGEVFADLEPSIVDLPAGRRSLAKHRRALRPALESIRQFFVENIHVLLGQIQG